MKQLFLRDEPIQIFFSDEATNEQIKNWVAANLDQFSLNEEHSCKVSLGISLKNRIVIDGDEDLVKIDIKPIIPKGTW